MDTHQAQRLLSSRGIDSRRLEKKTGSFGKELFMVDDRYLLRTSASPMDAEIAKFERVKGLASVPHVLETGTWEGEAEGSGPTHWILVELIPGAELFDTLDTLSAADQKRVALALSAFLDGLHAIRGEGYDMGHYFPVIGDFAGSWRQGHAAYQDWLREGLAPLDLDTRERAVVDRCVAWMRDHADCLAFEAGPRLLHNDFHPRNIIVKDGAFSGVIDWECSQWGEGDFELVHFAHWHLSPVDSGPSLAVLTEALFAAQGRARPVPRLPERIKTYLVEHDLFQIVLSKGARKGLFFPRLEGWLAGTSDRFFEQCGR